MSGTVGICISGGGARIGFAVGVLERIFAIGIKPELVYGISSGSLCTAALCYGDLHFLKETLLAIRRKEDVLDSQWLKTLITQLLGRGRADGLYGMETMRRKLDGLPRAKPALKGSVGFVDLAGGGMHYVASTEVPKKEFLDAVQASCTIPLVMQTQRVKGQVRVDGGVRDILPLKRLIDDPLGVVEIHVICLSPVLPIPEPVGKKLIDVSIRAIDLMVNEVLQDDLKMAKLYNRMLRNDLGDMIPGKRLVRIFDYIPRFPICDTIDFNRENIQKGIDHGNEIADEVLRHYPLGHA